MTNSNTRETSANGSRERLSQGQLTCQWAFWKMHIFAALLRMLGC